MGSPYGAGRPGLYREREANGHPEAAGTINRALVWYAADRHQWYERHTDVAALESRADLHDRTGLGLSTLQLLWRDRKSNRHPEPEKTIGNPGTAVGLCPAERCSRARGEDAGGAHNLPSGGGGRGLVSCVVRAARGSPLRCTRG